MDILFKVTDPAGPNHEVVSESNFKSHFPTIHDHIAWKKLEPYIGQATRRFILPFIERREFSYLTFTAYNRTSSTEMDDLIELLQDGVDYVRLPEGLLSAIPIRGTYNHQCCPSGLFHLLPCSLEQSSVHFVRIRFIGYQNGFALGAPVW